MFKLKSRQKHTGRNLKRDIELQPTLPETLRGKTGSEESTTSNIASPRFDVRKLPERLRTNSVMTAMELLAIEYEEPSDDEERTMDDRTRTLPKLASGAHKR